MRLESSNDHDLLSRLDPPDGVVDELVERSLVRKPRSFRRARLLALAFALGILAAFWFGSSRVELGPAVLTEFAPAPVEGAEPVVAVSIVGRRSVIQTAPGHGVRTVSTRGSIQIVGSVSP